MTKERLVELEDVLRHGESIQALEAFNHALRDLKTDDWGKRLFKFDKKVMISRESIVSRL